MFTKPSDVLPVSQREHGGDNEVERDGHGRPVLETYCWLCDGTGKRPSPRVEGNWVKCQGCKGTGVRKKHFKRVTSYIDVLEDHSNLTAWEGRMVLIGSALEPSLTEGAFRLLQEQQAAEETLRLRRRTATPEEVEEMEEAIKEPRNELTRRSKVAKEAAGAHAKAEHGTHLHGMSELVDRKADMPSGLPYEDVVDMMAYRRGTHGIFLIRHMERLVVQDELGVAGTPDRISTIDAEGILALIDEGRVNSDLFRIEDGKIVLIAPDGTEITPEQQLITDLKTGRVDYGGLKMAMQLAIYSRSGHYVKGSPDRTPLENINTKWGVIMHLAAGSGELHMYWADLELGWRAVLVARDVHEMRRLSKKALLPARFCN